MKDYRPPKRMMSGGDWFYFVTSSDRPHDAKIISNDIQRSGYRTRVWVRANKHFIYKGIKRGNKFNRVIK